MKQVNIYIYTTNRSPRKKSSAYAYVLEMETSKEPVTLSKIGIHEPMTANQAELTTLIEALERLNKSCNLTIFTDSPYVSGSLTQGWLTKWQQDNWLNAKGDAVSNAAEWQKAANLLNKHTYRVEIGNNHQYKAWMVRETKKAEDKICQT